ncbi:MAG TPA: M23 family metallopeptidase [Clostridiales bacterium]|nr:M23 family metallopeptidase [Clostridiales bacterium]
MNKNKFTEFFKGKGYYVLLFIGVLAIGAVAVVGSQLSLDLQNEEQNYVDLNDTDDNITAGEDTELAENNPVSDQIVNPESNLGDDVTNDLGSSYDAQVEYEGYGEDTTNTVDQASNQDTQQNQQAAATTEEEETSVATAGNEVKNEENIISNLSFKADDGLSWPVQGDVIMNYSMDHTIYFATLMQYKVNPAIIISAEVGTEVKAAADGVVTGIDANNPETGYTITMSIGDGYSVVYGQLNGESVALKVGDKVEAGDTIGTIAKPSKYYSVEGSNLYFQVMENDQTVNPMSLLR